MNGRGKAPRDDDPAEEPAVPAHERLRREREAIARRWRRELAGVEPPALADDLPRLLGEIEDALRRAAGAIRHGRGEVGRLPRLTGERIAAVGLPRVFTELGALRRVVARTLDPASPLTPDEWCALHRAFDDELVAAATAFADLHVARERAARREAQRRLRRLEALRWVMEAILASDAPVAQVLDPVCGRLQSVFDADAAAILLADEPHGALMHRAVRGEPSGACPTRPVDPTAGLTARALAAETGVRIDHLDERDRGDPLFAGLDPASAMVVPIRYRNGGFGVAWVASGRPSAFDDEDLGHLRLVADRIALAITQRRLYEQTQDAIGRLEAERRLRETFVGAVVHDIRSPLSALSMYLELLEEGQDDPDLAQEATAAIRRNARRIDTLTQNLLDVTRVTVGRRLPLDLEPLDVAQWVAGWCAEKNAQLREPRVELRRDPESLEGWWSPEALRRILDNLVENALKYGRADTPVVVALRRRGDRAVLTVENRGDAIPPDRLPTIFEPFVQVDDRRRGWGMGLALVRGLAQAHGGSVAVESADDRTCFTVELPLDARPFQD